MLRKHLRDEIDPTKPPGLQNAMKLLNEAEGSPIAILNHNIPAAYLVPAETYEWLMDKLEDAELAQIVLGRAHEKESAVEVNLDEL
jgi:antitoxin StbD